ncbi:N-(5'-phosphoribosyl)anthranilate isomerase [bacterium]|nr:N-(5'-phosphoribosyl)anthranilate isomerase [bacterium]
MQTQITQAPIPQAAVPAFSPDRWLYQLFSPLAVASGCPLRRDVADVEANIGRERLLQEARLRGYRVVEEQGQFTLLLNREQMQVMI